MHFMRFLGIKEKAQRTDNYLYKAIINAFKTLTEMEYMQCPLTKNGYYKISQHFRFPFGASKGWRTKHSSMDTVFTFNEVEEASRIIRKNNDTLEYHTCLGDILQVTAFLRSQSDIAQTLNGNPYNSTQTQISMVDLDDMAEALGITPKRLFKNLQHVRKCKLGTYRVITLIPHVRGEARTRLVVFTRYGRTSSTTLTQAIRRLKAFYKNDYDLIKNTNKLAVQLPGPNRESRLAANDNNEKGE